MDPPAEPLTDLIVYATPTGPLAEAVERYLKDSERLCGTNEAHRYPPHITLTGFFHDVPRSIPGYERALDRAVRAASPPPTPVLYVAGLHTRGDWHGLEIRSPWLQSVAAGFAANAAASSPTRADTIRLKDWLHLSLAYEFGPAHEPALASAALASVDPRALAGWRVGLWQRDGDRWTSHWSVAVA